MVTFKVVIGVKNGTCIQKEIQDPDAASFLGKKIGDTVKGEAFGLPAGYEFQITGGSDYCGFPMRKDVEGFSRKRILTVQGVGVRRLGKGMRQRKTVCGNVIHPKTAQINMKVVKEGSTPLVEEKPKEEKKE